MSAKIKREEMCEIKLFLVDFAECDKAVRGENLFWLIKLTPLGIKGLSVRSKFN